MRTRRPHLIAASMAAVSLVLLLTGCSTGEDQARARLLDEVDATLTTIQVNLQARTFADFADFVAAGDRDRTVQTKWGCGTRCLTWIDRTSPGSGIGLGEETAADLYSPVGGPRIVATTRTYDPDRGTVVFYAASLWDSYVNEFTSHHDFIDEACFAVAIDTARRSMRSEWAECPELPSGFPPVPAGDASTVTALDAGAFPADIWIDYTWAPPRPDGG